MPTTNSSPEDESDDERPPARPAPPWLYGVVTIPFGVAAGFAQFAMPFLLRRVGVSMEEISKYAALCLIPASYQFFWAPIIDLGPRRKHWLLIMSALGAVCLFGALLLPLPTSLPTFIKLVVAAQVFTGLVGSCSGGLMATTLPNEMRGRAGGWSNAGNLGGAALGGGVVMWFSRTMAPHLLGLITALMVFLPALGVLAIEEHARVKRKIKDVFGGVLGSIWKTLASRAGLTGILICISPVGTAALLGLFSGMGPDYHASDTVVTFVTGFAGGLVTASGSLIGGYFCDRIPRRVAYLVSGGLTAICGLTMSFFPLTEQTFIYGATVYLFISGFCYASFSALVLEVVGKAGASASTQYTLFTAAGNQAIAYTTWIDGLGSARWGTPGLLRTDALANVVGIAFLAIVMTLIARYRRTSPSAPAASAR